MTDTTPQTTIDHADYAGFWIRFAAACIDMLFYVPFYYAIKFTFGAEYRWWGEVAFVVFGLVTYSMFFASRMQASPGMYLLRFHVSTAHGRRVSFSRAMLWSVVSSIGFLLCAAGLIYLQMRFDIYAVHDLITSCHEQNIAPEDCAKEIETLIGMPFFTFSHICIASLALLVFLLFIWALSVALPKDKTGFHNLVCGTRFVKGRA